MKKIIIGTAVLLSGCVVEPAHVYVPPPEPVYVAPAPVYQAPAPQPVVSVYLDPPLEQPAPIRIGWAPPPILVETPPPLPYEGAVWTGGYWTWQGNWVWAHGRWAPPPRPGYTWCHPYYENRGGAVVFVNGFWAAPGVSFAAPGLNVNISLGVVAAGVVAGPAPIGPSGVFIPAPPGSHPGLIVPAPIGTAPSVVTSAPPIIHEGMRVTVNNTTNNNVHNTANINNVTNVTNVTIVAPAGATATGQAVNSSVPAQAHLAAAMPPVVKAYAPEPASAKPVQAYVPGRPLPTLPPAQTVHPEVNQALMKQQMHPAAAPAPAAQQQQQHPTPAPQQQQPQTQQRPAPAPTPAAQPAPNQPKPAAQPNGNNQQEREDFERRQAQPAQQAKPAPAPAPAQQKPAPQAEPKPAPQQAKPAPAPAQKPAQQPPANKPKPEANKEQKPKEEKHEEGRGEKRERE